MKRLWIPLILCGALLATACSSGKKSAETAAPTEASQSAEASATPGMITTLEGLGELRGESPSQPTATPEPEEAQGEGIPRNYTAKDKTTMDYFGTVSSVRFYGDFARQGETDRCNATWQKVKDLLSELDNLLSTTVDTSEISRFNSLKQGESMSVSATTAEVWQIAVSLWERTGGYFNPAMFPLTDLWAFSPRYVYSSEKVKPYDRDRTDGAFPLPEDAYVEAFLKLADPGNILLTGSDEAGWTLTKNVPAVTVNGVTYEAKIDLGGIVKGYATDRVEALLREDGWTYSYFSCGESSMCMLKSASDKAVKNGVPDYILGIRAPRATDTGLYASVAISDECLSSSGDYENNYTVNGELYCHIINPKTGRPLNVTGSLPQQGISTVTLMSGSATEDDALTTALCLMGPEEAIRFFNEELPGRDVLMVLYSSDSSTYEVVTNLPDSRLTLLDERYVLASTVDDAGRIVYTGTLFAK